MFQSFEVVSRPDQAAPRIAALRALFPELGINAFLVPHADAYQGEYLPPSAERLAFLTGFTGSAGIALIMEETAIVFVDGRYTTQLAAQVDPALISAGDLVGAPPHVFLAGRKPHGLKLGIDPWLHTLKEVEQLKQALAGFGGGLVLVDANPVDRIWSDRPAEPMGKISIQPDHLAGEPARGKLGAIAAMLAGKHADALLVSDPTAVAWLFNIRGLDVAHTPSPLSRAIIRRDGTAMIFIDPDKIDDEVREYLTPLAGLAPPEEFGPAVSELAKAKATMLLDPAQAPFAVVRLIEGAGGIWEGQPDPVVLARAVKNGAELSGSRQAHLQDGVAMVSFLAWLDRQDPGSVSEIAAAEALEDARRKTGDRMQNPLKDISFETISGAGPNAAIIHYRVTTDTNRMLQAGEMYLVDSGGQYQNGTTDITRTFAIGTVPAEQKRFFTLVLKGMIAISAARFPVGTRGQDIDPLARIALWKAGADFGHGTGHGVGSYLSVHEGPQRISRAGSAELKPGMIISNEPGYYLPGKFGIRIENLLVVTEAAPVAGGDRPMLGFETLTWCPIDARLIDTALLTREELVWLDAYHGAVREKLLPLVTDAAERDWLEAATRPLT
ncbi:aminopeptidase P family protein [Martelella alba]|uniref:Aminopeptidase P family protein n=1 Tax=Martelella alba TaxID=2590451 RepID=A0A506U4P8_9HYPH|nr:aminopeptidase P family protein [Martelella alba]TPW28024.1 aminopeptidase P family protein [Martelella alba]